MKEIAYKYGAVSAGIMIVPMVIPMLIWGTEFDLELAEWLGYISMILAMLGVYFGTRSYRDHALDGNISFGKAFASGVLISLVAALIFGIFTVFLYKFVLTDFADKYMDYSIEKIREGGAAADEIARQIAEVNENRKLWRNPFFNGLVMFATVFPIGAIIALISAAVLKKS